MTTSDHWGEDERVPATWSIIFRALDRHCSHLQYFLLWFPSNNGFLITLVHFFSYFSCSSVQVDLAFTFRSFEVYFLFTCEEHLYFRHAAKPVIVSAGYTTDRSTYNIWVVLNIRRCSFDPKTLGYLKYNLRTSGTLVGGSTSPPPTLL